MEIPILHENISCLVHVYKQSKLAEVKWLKENQLHAQFKLHNLTRTLYR